MVAIELDQTQQKLIDELPPIHDFSRFYFYLRSSQRDKEYMGILSRISGLNHNILADWLNISPKTFRNYKNNPHLELKENTKEHLLSLISLYKHGIEVFGNKESFEAWLLLKNPLLDDQAPLDFLDTISGIKWIDNKLTSMEYGENA